MFRMLAPGVRRSRRWLSASSRFESSRRRHAPIKTETEEKHEWILSALVVNRPGTLAQIADVFGYADQNITGLCVRPTVVPELSRVTISCFLRQRELPVLKKRLRALVVVTFFHVTTKRVCLAHEEQLLVRSQLLVQIRRDSRRQHELSRVLETFQAEVIVPQDEQDAERDEPLADVDSGDNDKLDSDDGASSTQLLTLVDDPERLTTFMDTLMKEGFEILETQIGGPVFLDTSHSTLDPESAFSFRRKIASEVEKMLFVPAEKEASPANDPFVCEGPTSVDDGQGTSSEAEPVDADKMLPTSTYELHTNDQGHFSPHRLRLHARIAQQLYASAPQDLTVPTFILLLGIPGSGKSTMLSHLDLVGHVTLQACVNFDVDDVIALLPEFYHAMLNVGLGNDPESRSLPDVEAAQRSATRGMRWLPGPQTRYQLCRDEARFILQKNLQSAIMCRKNIILHGSGKSLMTYARTIDQVKAAGFDVHVICLDIARAEAYKRVEKRSRGYGRDVPRPIIDTASSLITRTFRQLASRVPNAHLFDSMRIPLRLVWSKQDSEVEVNHPDDDVQRKYGVE